MAACSREADLAQMQWQGLEHPGDTVVAYVNALKVDNLDRAIGFLYLPKGVDMQTLKASFLPVVIRVQREDWNVRIKETLEHNRFAAVIYTTRKDLADPEPMLAARDDEGHWKLYHMATAGNLNQFFHGSDLDDARFVVRKGKERMAEIHGLLRSKAEEKDKE